MNTFLKYLIVVAISIIAAAMITVFSWHKKESFMDVLPGEISKVVEHKKAKVNVVILRGNEVITQTCPYKEGDYDLQYPLFSVFKFHLALALLDKVDKGELSLDQKIKVEKDDLPFAEFSELKRKYPGGGVEVTLREILEDTVSHSDNNGCDILLNLIGGPETVQAYLDERGAHEVSIAATEGELHISPSFFMQNKSTSIGLSLLLDAFDKGDLLSPESTALLRQMMEDSPTGAKRIKGLLPEGTVVAHKTGTGPRIDGVAAACNDAGIVTLPDGSKMIIVAFVTESSESDEENDRIIAEITKLAWEFFVQEGKKKR